MKRGIILFLMLICTYLAVAQSSPLVTQTEAPRNHEIGVGADALLMIVPGISSLPVSIYYRQSDSTLGNWRLIAYYEKDLFTGGYQIQRDKLLPGNHNNAFGLKFGLMRFLPIVSRLNFTYGIDEGYRYISGKYSGSVYSYNSTPPTLFQREASYRQHAISFSPHAGLRFDASDHIAISTELSPDVWLLFTSANETLKGPNGTPSSSSWNQADLGFDLRETILHIYLGYKF